jgi:SAM-dependent methyltransferase
MQVRACDRRARNAFLDLALALAQPGRCIFDFGAGPGIDAKPYAAAGFKVLAYDVDTLMCSALEEHCSQEIASGRVTLYQGDYQSFLEDQIPQIRQQHTIGLITANFAPLSLIDDLSALFAALHQLTAPDAMLLASVLNPDYPGDWSYRWWWAHRFTYWRNGRFCIHGEHDNIHRRSRRTLAALAAPWFTLQSVHGLPLPGLARGIPALNRYLFLLYKRR